MQHPFRDLAGVGPAPFQVETYQGGDVPLPGR